MHDQPCHPPAFHYFAPIRNYLSHLSIMGSIINLPPPDKNKGNVPYSELVCTEQDRARITELITAMAENNYLDLLLQKNYLKQLGASINHVHPLKFLSVVFTNPYLKKCMGEVLKDYFTRTNFLEGLGANLTKEAEKKRLDAYALDFAKEVNAPLDGIQHFFNSRDWEGFVRYLMRI